VPAKITQEEFDLRVRAVFGDKLNIDGFVYSRYNCRGRVTCPTHGPYEVSAQNLLKGFGCIKCYRESRIGVLKDDLSAFVAKARDAHGDKYDYSSSVYIGAKKKISILCPEHGEFSQEAWGHTKGKGCPLCGSVKAGLSNQLSQADFMSKAITAHGDKYDLRNVVFSGGKNKIEVLCREHGAFHPSAGNFLYRKSGCPSCAAEALGFRSRLSPDEYIARARSVHGDRFTYGNVVYKANAAYLEIECSKHGVFTQLAQDHLNGVGCAKCSKPTFSTASFVDNAMLVHGDRYGYALSDYTGSTTKVSITCKIHGEFVQTPNMHVNESQGCPQCARVGPSAGQLEVASLLAQHTSVIVGHKLGRFELDVFLPEHMLAIEYHGLVWHSTKYQKDITRDFKKHKLASEHGIRVIHLYADEWRFKKDLFSSLLLSAIGHQYKRVFARSLSVIRVGGEASQKFYSEYHTQGPLNTSTTTYALHDGVAPVAMMSFSRVTSQRGQVARPDKYELRRYATSRTVVGGASRLMASFLRDHPDCKTLLSYSENRLFSGAMYDRLGFKVSHISKPSYWYITTSLRDGRMDKARFKRSALEKINGFRFDPAMSERANCEANGYYQVHDCGKTCWVFTRP